MFYLSRISLVNGDLNNVDEDEMYFVGDGKDDCEEKDAPRMYPFHEQNVVDEDVASSGISYEKKSEDNHSQPAGSSSGTDSDSREEISSSVGPTSWFSLSTRRSEASSLARNLRKPGHTVDEEDDTAINGISGKMKRQDDDIVEIDISKSADTFADDLGVTDSDSRGVLSSIGPASWFSRSTGRSEASSVKDKSTKE